MSNHISNLVWKHSQEKGNGLLLMVALADIANDHGHAWPGTKHLADKTRMTRQTVSTYVNRLDGSELRVYVNPGRAHDYIVTVGMSRADIWESVTTLADRRGLTVLQLERLRVSRNRTTGDVKKPDNGCKDDPTTVVKTTRHDPSVTPSEPSVPKGVEPDGPTGTHTQFKNALLLALHGKKWPEDKATIPASLWPPLDDQAKWWRGEKTKADRQPPPGVTPERIIAFYAWWKGTRPATDLPTSHEAIVKWWPVWEIEQAKQANGRREYQKVLR